MAELRGKLVWVDDSRKSLGFGEHHPIDNLGRDNYRSQANRRVEVLMFDEGDEPDLAAGNGDEIYDGSIYNRKPLPAISPGTAFLNVRVHDSRPTPMKTVPFRVSFSDQVLAEGTTENGWVRCAIDATMCFEYLDLEWGNMEAGTYAFRRTVAIECSVGSERDQATARLHNLGYPSQTDEEYDFAVLAFQADYGVPERGLEDGSLPPKTRERLWSLYTGNCDATRPPPE